MDTIKEIITIASILIKFEREDILEDKNLFIEFINVLGLRYKGRYFNRQSFTNLINSLSEHEKQELLEDFNTGYKNVYQVMEMYSK